ncbi:Ribokinase-like protein [Roridomyces roridus]|uniref:Ribokinase-like protein n=1 Tax=Roridomyces roridus TaxID=1738132 RepID=A0AAD7BHX8_9AGAR|nr:Ribokinase-like protein [Roridomyces roridus]
MPARCLVRGSINVDEFFQVKDIVRPGETISSTELVKRAGGKGANQAVALGRAGAIVDLVGALQGAGVGVEGVSIAHENTGRAIIQVTELGENSIILFKGANYASIPPRPIHPDTTHIVLQNEIPLESTIDGEAFDLCSALGLEMTNLNKPDPSVSARAAAKPLLSLLAAHLPTTNIVCTLGAHGVLANLTLLAATIHIPAAELQGSERDTTGAGDCFTGYMVAGLMSLEAKNATPTAADYVAVLRRATQAAGMCVEKAGALASIPLGSEVDARLG